MTDAARQAVEGVCGEFEKVSLPDCEGRTGRYSVFCATCRKSVELHWLRAALDRVTALEKDLAHWQTCSACNEKMDKPGHCHEAESEEIVGLNKMLDDVLTRAEIAEAKVAALEQEIRRLTAESDELDSDITELSSRIEELQQEKATLRAKVTALEHEAATLRRLVGHGEPRLGPSDEEAT